MNKEELALLLKKTNKMSNKYLARRILEVDCEDIVEKIRIKEKCYQLLLTLMDDKSKRTLLTLDAIHKLLVERICRDSNWRYEHNYFYFQDYANKEIFFVLRGEFGFRAVDEDKLAYKKEHAFVLEYKSVLDMLNNNLKEKEEFLKGNFKTKNPSDYELANSLIDYLEIELPNNAKIYRK